jgi:propanol-preferring alcohol dehydrogenase
MVLNRPGPIEGSPLTLETLPDPRPDAGEIVVQVAACGVCRTDLHVIEGELDALRPRIVPGHQAVGTVCARGPGAERFGIGARVGVAWLHRACGSCSYCASGAENLCRSPTFTGWHVDGGYAERVKVPEAFAYAVPEIFGAEEAAPLLCAGIIGYRALRRADVRPGCRLGLYGFGSSAHISLQVARHWDCEVFVVTREPSHRRLALELGAAWAGGLAEEPPELLDSAINFAPVGDLVPPALRALRPGGTLACAGIYMSDVPRLDYRKELFQEKTLTSTTANTRRDGEELLALAAEIPIRPRTTPFRLEEANLALQQLKRGEVVGSAVLLV